MTPDAAHPGAARGALIADSSTYSLTMRTEGRETSPETGTPTSIDARVLQFDIAATASMQLGMWTLTAGYQPRILTFLPDQAGVYGVTAFNNANLGAEVRLGPSQKLRISEGAGYGTQDNSPLNASAPGQTAVQQLLSYNPRLPLVEILASVMSTSQLAYTQQIFPDLTAAAHASYSLSGGADAIARDFIPFQHSLGGDANLAWRADHSNTLTLATSVTGANFADGSRSRLASGSASWAAQVGRDNSLALTLGGSLAHSAGNSQATGWQPEANGSATLSSVLINGPERLSGNLRLGVSTVIDSSRRWLLRTRRRARRTQLRPVSRSALLDERRRRTGADRRRAERADDGGLRALWRLPRLRRGRRLAGGARVLASCPSGRVRGGRVGDAMGRLRRGHRRRERALLMGRAAAALLLALLSPGLSGADSAPAGQPLPGSTRIFDARGGLAPGWEDIGWAPRSLVKGAPASLDLSGRGGWIIAHPGLTGAFGWLSFRMRAPASFGAFLEVGVDSVSPERFPRVRVSPDKGTPAADGFIAYRVSIGELDPKGVQFDRIVFHAAEPVGQDKVELDDIALAERDAASAAAAAAFAPGRRVRVVVNCAARGRPISPLIYGLGATDNRWWETGATARRWGGNPTSRYNWEFGRVWNTGNDWFFRNVDGASADAWLDEGLRHGVKSTLTVPMLGWVAKDATSYSFPVSVFGPQRAVAPENADIGNGVAPDGSLLKPGAPELTSVAAPPEFVRRWVSAIRAKDKESGRGRSAQTYILDNEPTLWNVTHRDVHPAPVSYDELLDRTLRYATAVREADPPANIAGFVGWGWSGYFYSALDLASGAVPHVDRLSHGNTPLLPWWLGKVRDYEKSTGKHLIDILDVHFYPQANGVGYTKSGNTDPEGAALRIRSTRALWDPTYVDESWINEPINLIPRLHQWVDENAPGLGISIGEYNFGAELHMSGGLAVAEALGRFGEGGLTSAYYWPAPPADSPAFWAFRAYRNFDGKGGHFLDTSVPVQVDRQLASVFASRDPASGHLVAVLLNFDPATADDTELDLSSCGKTLGQQLFTYAGAKEGFTAAAPPALLPSGNLSLRLPPYSMTVLDLTGARPR